MIKIANCLTKMNSNMKLIILINFILLLSIKAYEQSDVVFAKIETCRGCSLNRLPEVKQFVMQDAPSYENLDVKFITGAPPELVVLGVDDQELERLPLSHLNRKECNELLLSKGFTKKTIKEEF